MNQFYLDRILEGQRPLVVGWSLISWGTFMAYVWIASFRVTPVVMLVFLLLTATFCALVLSKNVLSTSALWTN